MKDSLSKKQAYNFTPGQVITGKWHGNKYRIIRILGEGAIGRVYLAQTGGRLVAVKVARQAMSVSSEVNVLRRVSKVQGLSLGPSFLDMDDVVTSHGTTSFYVMEFIQGQPFMPFVINKGSEWLGLFTAQLLGDLHKMHAGGWIFGDLKPENLLITKQPYQLRWIDPGGITKAGRSIKEYTEYFDRGYWGEGDRKAEPSYDLFAVAMLMVNRAYPSRFRKTSQKGTDYILEKVTGAPLLHPYFTVIKKGIEQKYEDAGQMKEDVLMALRNQKRAAVPSRLKRKAVLKKRNAPVNKTAGTPVTRERKGYLETVFFASFLLTIYILYLVG
ncbi:protein kinase domain-containing protein [Salipaludibacillus aurantiacus]|uniref:Serine/threonine protein kinase n=1 Tax=Salipaludibacillus aurantiacus TaxID=1601833 RepID=A0A1H9X3Z5_9BACI|nr:serine/threonine-protein kinase [Salipaludibacillus aurantiacus]SES40882.1 serine/threonine protein kinase [Salipaludibacillus aurantiacus]